MQISPAEIADAMPGWVLQDMQEYDAVIYTRPDCVACDEAQQLLQPLGPRLKTRTITDYERQVLTMHTGQRTYPYIFLHGEFVGGRDDLKARFTLRSGRTMIVKDSGKLVRIVSSSEGGVVAQYLHDGVQVVIQPALLTDKHSTPFEME